MLVTMIRTEKESAFTLSRVWWFNPGQEKRLTEQVNTMCMSFCWLLQRNAGCHSPQVMQLTRVVLLGLLLCLQTRQFINVVSTIHVSEEEAAPWSFLVVPQSNSHAQHILRGSVWLERAVGVSRVLAAYEYLRVINVKLVFNDLVYM